MALRAVPDHPKFADFKLRLNIPKGVALGWIECVWHFCGRFTPRGDIGKYSDESIEAWVEWNGQPGALVAALVEAGWIDRDPVHRLVAVNWAGYWGHSKRARRWERMKAAGGEIRYAQRIRIYDRDNWMCQICGDEDDITLDHKIPISKGGMNHDSNLRVLCRSCNSSKKDRVEVTQ